jgi:hypothetical protein
VLLLLEVAEALVVRLSTLREPVVLILATVAVMAARVLLGLVLIKEVPAAQAGILATVALA